MHDLFKQIDQSFDEVFEETEKRLNGGHCPACMHELEIEHSGDATCPVCFLTITAVGIVEQEVESKS